VKVEINDDVLVIEEQRRFEVEEDDQRWGVYRSAQLREVPAHHPTPRKTSIRRARPANFENGIVDVRLKILEQARLGARASFVCSARACAAQKSRSGTSHSGPPPRRPAVESSRERQEQQDARRDSARPRCPGY
jgi:hypothetical protein